MTSLSVVVWKMEPQCRKLQNELCKIIDPEKDSLRFYYLGKKYENKIEHFGCKQTYLPEEPMIL